ncbi:MAG TPA: ABC transporter permease [Thermoanaerobaculia bacterium]|nr:ABC transporter permease [Thermoanaerobaculia bacterium]
MKTQLKLALKVLGRRKAFTAISLFGITITLAVLMAAAAMVDNLIAPGQPESRFDRALTVSRVGQYGDRFSMSTDPGYAFLDQFVRTLPGIENSSIYSNVQSTALYRDGGRIDAMLKRTDGAYWQILDFRFLEGGPYSAEDDAAGRHVAVINEDIREKLFDGQPAVGRSIEVDGQQFRIVGVVPRVPFLRLTAYSQVWVPIGTMKSAEYRHRMLGGFQGVILASDRADFPALKREFESRLPRVPIEDPKQFHVTKAGLDTPFEALSRLILVRNRPDATSTTKAAIVLALLAVMFMTLPALNLITLNLSRILERSSEIGVRRAFGAPRGSLVRQFLFENVVMTIIGGIAGFALAAVILPLLASLAPVPDLSFSLNLRVFAWGLFFAIVFGSLSGIYPAWKMSRLHPVNALRGGSK